MSRDWHAVYAAVLGKSKYRRLTIPARAALFHVWMLAGGQEPEATWQTRAELADVLDLDGYPLGVLDELIERRWVDVDDRGRLTVHDWDDHQLAATSAARRAYERDRKTDWRRQRDRPQKAERPSPLSPAPLSPTGHHITGQESPIVPDVSRTGEVEKPLAPQGAPPPEPPEQDTDLLLIAEDNLTRAAGRDEIPDAIRDRTLALVGRGTPTVIATHVGRALRESEAEADSVLRAAEARLAPAFA